MGWDGVGRWLRRPRRCPHRTALVWPFRSPLLEETNRKPNSARRRAAPHPTALPPQQQRGREGDGGRCGARPPPKDPHPPKSPQTKQGRAAGPGHIGFSSFFPPPFDDSWLDFGGAALGFPFHFGAGVGVGHHSPHSSSSPSTDSAAYLLAWLNCGVQCQCCRATPCPTTRQTHPPVVPILQKALNPKAL